MVPADSGGIPRVPPYSGTRGAPRDFAHGALTLCGAALQRLALVPRIRRVAGPTTPRGPEPPRFGLLPGRSPLLGESFLFSFPPGTKMFQFPGFAPSIGWCRPFRPAGCPIRTRPDQLLFADPRTFSQLTASFIASESLGILRSLFSAFSS